jgi:hypothetical protein
MDWLEKAKKIVGDAEWNEGAFPLEIEIGKLCTSIIIAEQLTRIADALETRNTLLTQENELFAAIARGNDEL